MIINQFSLPIKYHSLSSSERKLVREQYITLQNNLCMYCFLSLNDSPIMDKAINWSLFPKGFMNYPIHLQHCHETGYTEGVVHAYCNAILWQYHNK